MEQLVNEIRLGYADRVINEKLAAIKPDAASAIVPFFNHSEELFLELPGTYQVPRLSIHHKYDQAVPDATYINALRDWMDSFIPVAPGFFSDLTYFFDPGEILKPCFYHLYRIGEAYYLYLLRIDLAFRPMEAELVERGTNDTTVAYRTKRVYLESDFIPLEAVISEMGKVIAFVVKQTISQTWIGETGKGYQIRGVWIDSELTKFLSKLFLPAGKKHYPFYPFTCRYKTLCMTVLDPTADARRALLPHLHRALGFVVPELEAIQDSLRNTAFDEKNGKFLELRQKVPESLPKLWTALQVTPYLNAHEHKEFRVVY